MTFEQIKSTFDALTEILNKEIDLLGGAKQVRAAAILPRKEFLQQQYMHALNYIKANANNFNNKQIEELAKKQTEVDKVAQKSREVLSIMVENNKKIVDEIIKNKVSNNNNYVSYGRNAKTYGNVGVSVSINKKV